MYFTWQALGVAKGNNKRLDQEALYTTELDKINIIDDTKFVSFRLQYSQLAFKQSKQNRNVKCLQNRFSIEMFEQKQTGKRKMELLPPKNFAT
jgi:hypothetical protein